MNFMKSDFSLQKFSVKLSISLVSCALLVSAANSQENISQEEAEGIIFERQNIMKQLDEDSELLGDIVAGIAPVEELGPVTASIAQSAKASQELFAIKLPGGRAKEEVWTNHDDYMARMAEFAQNSERMAELGEAGDVTGVTGMLIVALPCKQCHDVYREKRK
jgi:cytochrome c556